MAEGAFDGLMQKNTIYAKLSLDNCYGKYAPTQSTAKYWSQKAVTSETFDQIREI